MSKDKEFNIKINGLKEGIKDVKDLKGSLDNSKKSMEDQNKTVGDYSKAIREASKEIKNIQGQMLGLEKGSKQWQELAKKAGDYKDRIDDIREATKRWASDTKALDDVINLHSQQRQHSLLQRVQCLLLEWKQRVQSRQYRSFKVLWQ